MCRERRNRYEEFLKGVKLLVTMDEYERAKLADSFKARKLNGGEYIISEVLYDVLNWINDLKGEEGNEFFFLESGTAIATKTIEAGLLMIIKLNYQGNLQKR